MAATTTRLTINVHPAVEQFGVSDYPRTPERPWPFVSVELGGGVSLLISDAEVMAGLVELIGQARQQLADLDANTDDRPGEPEPVGDTGLFLHPMPVGEA